MTHWNPNYKFWDTNGLFVFLLSFIRDLQNKLEELYGNKARKEAVQSRLQDVYAIMDGLKNHQIVYNDELVRQIAGDKEKLKNV